LEEVQYKRKRAIGSKKEYQGKTHNLTRVVGNSTGFEYCPFQIRFGAPEHECSLFLNYLKITLLCLKNL
jgi:hypothetical protein